jgi:hypothetical protein
MITFKKSFEVEIKNQAHNWATQYRDQTNCTPPAKAIFFDEAEGYIEESGSRCTCTWGHPGGLRKHTHPVVSGPFYGPRGILVCIQEDQAYRTWKLLK